MIELSVILCSYNPRYNALISTVKSIIAQKKIIFELIILDDCSQTDYFKELCNYFKKASFTQYRLVKQEKNVGTVKSLMAGLKEAKGRYIKAISPGDFLYDELVLYEFVKFMNKNNAKIGFGDAIYYGNSNGIKIYNRSMPKKLDIYLKEKYDYNAIKHRYFICGDWINGASYMHDRIMLIEYLSKIQNRIKYAEDFITCLMILDEIKIYYNPQKVVWYEYGTGISTNTKSKLYNGFLKDLKELKNILLEYHFNNKYVKKFIFIDSLKRNKIIKFIIWVLRPPRRLILKLIKKDSVRKNNINLGLLDKWIKN